MLPRRLHTFESLKKMGYKPLEIANTLQDQEDELEKERLAKLATDHQNNSGALEVATVFTNPADHSVEGRDNGLKEGITKPNTFIY